MSENVLYVMIIYISCFQIGLHKPQKYFYDENFQMYGIGMLQEVKCYLYPFDKYFNRDTEHWLTMVKLSHN